MQEGSQETARGMKVEDYYHLAKACRVGLHAKGVTRHEVPPHHKLEASTSGGQSAAGELAAHRSAALPLDRIRLAPHP